MLPITDALISGMNRPGRKLYQIKGIAIHYTANSAPSATALNNRNYFNNNSSTYASAHYVVDENTIVRCIPDDEVAYHVGANSYTQAANQMTGGENPNNYLIGIEICNNGNWAKAVENSAQLAAYLIHLHGLPANCLWRHYDVTWKNCPAPMVQDPSQWEAFKSRVAQLLGTNPTPSSSSVQDYQAIGIVNGASVLNVRSGPGTNYSIITTLKDGQQFDIVGMVPGWFKMSNGGFVSAQYIHVEQRTAPVTPGQYQTGVINANGGLNLRSSAAWNASIILTIPNGQQIQIIANAGNGWLNVSYNGHQGYVAAQYVKVAAASTPVTPATPKVIGHGTVTANGGLNVRSGPGTNYGILGSLTSGATFEIFESANGWYKLDYNGKSGWVSAQYVK